MILGVAMTMIPTWLVDFEFSAPTGERPSVVCMVAREYHSGQLIRATGEQLRGMPQCPFPTGASSLFVAYYASAELGCFLDLGWSMPERILDLFAEFRCLTNGRPIPCGNGLLGALAYFGLDAIDAAEKTEMRELALRGGPYTAGEMEALLDYCQTDVDALARLLPLMWPRIDLPRALLRGRYMAAAARMEWTGTPIDQETLRSLRAHWTGIQSRLIEQIDRDYGVFVPTGRSVSDAIRSEAAEAEIDPYDLADAVDYLYRCEKERQAVQRDSLATARRITGLDARRIAAWEDAGHDYSTWPELDVHARALAGQYPDLGIGTGYSSETGDDDNDYAAELWELLRNGQAGIPRKTDLIPQAAELVREQSTAIPTLRRLSFSTAKWAEYLARNDIPWPLLERGKLALDDGTFRQMAKAYPRVAPIRELRHSLGKLRLNDLAVGNDGRNRCLLSAFRARTGRNQPSNSRFIFGPSCWLRGLIKPERDRAVAYIDYSQQEFAIAAALAGDHSMMEAYRSGDPYLTFAKQAGAAPANATKQSHGEIRSQFKVCALAVQYGQGAKSLAATLGRPEVYARELIYKHQQTYPRYWRWSRAVVDHAMLHGWLQTVFGWRVHVGREANPRSLANFPVQGNGAEMLRLACCLVTEAGINVCAPVHDAVLIEGPTDEIEALVAKTQRLMAQASKIILDGFSVQTDAEIIRYPNRYMDGRGKQMWDAVCRELESLRTGTKVSSGETAFPRIETPVFQTATPVQFF